MPSTTDILKFLLLILAALVVAILGVSKKGNRILGFLVGGMLVFAGALGLVTGRIGQVWNCGPPLDGPLATVGSVFLLAGGLYTIYLAATGKPEDQDSKK
jgi:hypothetical protein